MEYTSVHVALRRMKGSKFCSDLVCLLLKRLLFVRRLKFLASGVPHSLHPLLHCLHVGDELADRRYGAQELWVELDTAASVGRGT